MFLALQTLDPLSYIALGNFKVVATGVLFFLCLGRNLTHLQWTKFWQPWTTDSVSYQIE